MALGVYYSLWMECLLTARQPKSCISPAHVKTWSERKNVSFICDNFVWRHVQDLSTRLFPGSGIWLLLRKRDSPKFGHGCRIGKENDIRICTGSGRVFSHEIQAGFGKTPNFFLRDTGIDRYSIGKRDSPKNWKKTVFGIEMTDVRGTGLWWKRGEIRDQDPSPPLPASWYTVIRVHFKTYL